MSLGLRNSLRLNFSLNKNRIKYRRIDFQVSSIQDQVDRLHPEWAKNISLEYHEEGRFSKG